MSIFGKDTNSDKVKFLDDERVKIWERIIKLEENVEKKVSDYEKEAKEASKKTSEYKNKANDTREQALVIYQELKKISEDVEREKDYIEKIKAIIDDINQNAQLNYTTITTNTLEINNKINELEEKITKINNITKEHPDLITELATLNTQLTQSKDNSNKIDLLHKNIIERKDEIDKLYYAIIGYVNTNDETGEKIEVEGLKSKLENQYKEIQERGDTLSQSISAIEKASQEKYQNIFDTWQTNFNGLNKKIEGLLPNALTAGLSSAFSNKKTTEEKSYKSLKIQFIIGILGLIFVSLIPFGISLYFFRQGEDLREIIQRIPNIAIAVLPLYLPVLWLAFSSNKRLNLSKRLIEEYTHKEVLSKTFEGLSSQINALEANEMSNELKLRLLFNILQVSSENPGKLISNYNRSDHPIMEVLDQTSRLQSSVEKLKNIPGLEKIARILDNKAQKIIDDKARKVDEILDKALEIKD